MTYSFIVEKKPTYLIAKGEGELTEANARRFLVDAYQACVEHKMNRAVRYDVNNGVVTLKGNVPSQGQRASMEKLAQQVPNVKQVVNELEVKNQRATSTK